MIKLLKHMKATYWLLAVVVIILVAVQVSCDLEMPDKLGIIMGQASLIQKLGPTASEELINAAKSEIWKNGLQMLGLAFVSVISTVIVCFLSAKIAAGFSAEIRKEVYRKVENFSMSEIDHFSTSSLITRSTNDITQVQMVVVMVLRMAVAAPIYSIYGIIKALEVNGAASLSFIVIISIIALTLLVVSIFVVVLPKFKKIQTLTDRLNLVTRENLTGLRVVRASNAYEFESAKFNEANQNITKNNLFVNRVFSIFSPGMRVIMNFTSLSILWVGAYKIFDNPALISSVFTFQQYTMMIVMGFMQLTMIIIMVPRGAVSGKRISEVLDSSTTINDPENSNNNTNETGTVEFKNVYFEYAGSEEPVLENISFKVNRGETLAIIGGTGCGKTTMINLIPRFFDANKGDVLVDGINVKEISQEELRNKIGYVPQKAVLFSGTIRSNLAFGKKNPTDYEIKEALDIAQASEFVEEIGYDALVAQGGSNYSGGQKQRLSIARAIIKKPEILIFDDSFSALDLKTDKLLREALREKVKGTTNIIVAQRIGTILHADKIIVLDQGKMVGYGTHKELLKNCSVYQEIAYSQLSKEELEDAR